MSTEEPLDNEDEARLSYWLLHEHGPGAGAPGRSRAILVRGYCGSSRLECDWELTFTEQNFTYGPTHVALTVPSWSFAVFARLPALFAMLGQPGLRTLDGVRAILDGLGATDETDRRSRRPAADK